MAPVFTHRNVVALAPAMTATAARAGERLAACGGRAELVGQMLTATFDVICDVALSGREHFDSHTFGHAITHYFQTAGRASLLDFLGFPDWFPRPGELLAGAFGRAPCMTWWARPSRRGARQAAPPADDLLDHMLAAEDPETGQRMSPQDLIHNMQFFIVAGHETTALALSWALYLLANAPEDQERAREQARGVLNGRPAEADDLAAMPFIHQVLEEAMRLYPPVGLLARTVVAKDELCGRIMQPNDILFLADLGAASPPAVVGTAGAVRPGPFRRDAGEVRDKYQYLPFGAGPRVCVGADFAMMQAQIILATLVGQFPLPPRRPAPHPVMTMTVRPEPGVFLEVVPIGA